MIRRGSRQGRWVMRQNLVADRRQPFAENLADIRMLSGSAHNCCHTVLVDIANGQLIEIGGESAARLDFAAGIDDQGLSRPLAEIFAEPVVVPTTSETLGTPTGAR